MGLTFLKNHNIPYFFWFFHTLLNTSLQGGGPGVQAFLVKSRSWKGSLSLGGCSQRIPWALMLGVVALVKRSEFKFNTDFGVNQ